MGNLTTIGKADTESVVDRIEGTIALGKTTCDICYRLEADERPDEGDFWPGVAIHYIRGHERTAVDFWGTTVCEFHDESKHVPEDATHRVLDQNEYVGDNPERSNSAYEHNVIGVTELQA